MVGEAGYHAADRTTKTKYKGSFPFDFAPDDGFKRGKLGSSVFGSF
jgi:hypothetical protein